MSFKDIKGQEGAIERLNNAIKNHKLASSYIFAGPNGSGRFLLALNFAKALNCASSEERPCDTCSSCRKIDNANHPDVRIVFPEGRGGEVTIEKIREIISEIALKPYEGRYKVFIIKDAQFLNNEAANSFLKTLEEPPANSILILIAERPLDLPLTIVSRCRIIRAAPLTRDNLAGILTAEYGVERLEAASLARICGGSFGRFKEAGGTLLSDRDKALEKFSGEEFIEELSQKDRGNLSNDLSILAAWYRDILVFKAANDPELIINCDRINDIKEESERYSKDMLLDAFSSILKAKDEIENNINPKIALSAMMAGGII